jgi:hypothetical protein
VRPSLSLLTPNSQPLVQRCQMPIMRDCEHQPGDPAPECGEYEALSVLGSPTKYRVQVGKRGRGLG